MALRRRDTEFKHLGVSYLDFKRVQMDRVLTGFLMRLNHKGLTSRLVRREDLFVKEFADEFTDPVNADRFQGFAEHPEMARRWVETQLLDVVNRGKPTQEVAGLRPLHGLTYRFRSSRHSRPYGADAQLYEMLRHARGPLGALALEQLRAFFFTGLGTAASTPAQKTPADIETQAVLHLNSQVKADSPHTVKGWYSAPPLCVGQADLLADDVVRLLSLKDLLPRITMVEYLKILFAFHLALGQFKAMKLLPVAVARSAADPACGHDRCPAIATAQDPLAGCPFRVGIFMDVAGVPGTPTAALAEHSAEHWLRRIPDFVRASYTVRKLDEFAEHLVGQGKERRTALGHFTVPELLRFGTEDYRTARDEFFSSRLTAILDDTPVSEQPEEIRPLLDESMGLAPFEKYLEVLMAYRGPYHHKYIFQAIDSLLLKNRSGAAIAQPHGGRRRFVLDSALLEVLVQVALLRLNPRGGASPYTHHTVSLRLDEFLALLRDRYGVYVDRLPTADGFGPAELEEESALRANAEAFTTRLREIGFYDDLSDAYLTQVITPRFSITVDGTVSTGGR
ncbi:methylation-associated defense system protein MAD7 [Streptomyces griseoviridis]|uniref:methylation-associated defense system protein MAD7 n=1 Tax=Streptomyces griseoviridis TaxID=45398 RepID=UPI003442CAC5